MQQREHKGNGICEMSYELRVYGNKRDGKVSSSALTERFMVIEMSSCLFFPSTLLYIHRRTGGRTDGRTNLFENKLNKELCMNSCNGITIIFREM